MSCLQQCTLFGVCVIRNYLFLCSIIFCLGLPINAQAQVASDLINFCRISQMLMPVILQAGGVSGYAVCEAGGSASPECKKNVSLSAGVCIAGRGDSYECRNAMSLGAAVCVAGGREAIECSNRLSLGAGVCMAGGGATSECLPSMGYARGVCLAGLSSPHECSVSMNIGTAICLAGGKSGYQCSGIEGNDLGEGICRALGGTTSQCTGISPSIAICSFTGSCEGYDPTSISMSIVKTCGIEVLSYGIK
tara:strand:+ start:357 stop:1103 length:747 start_codon:yes stop_codon:yes gene_type:complete